MSSISPASSRARMVLYRHMCCEPAVKTNVSPLRERGYNSVSGGKRGARPCSGHETHSGRTTGAQSLRARKKTGLEKSGVGTVCFGFWEVSEATRVGRRARERTRRRLPRDLFGHGVHRTCVLVRLYESDVAARTTRREGEFQRGLRFRGRDGGQSRTLRRERSRWSIIVASRRRARGSTPDIARAGDSAGEVRRRSLFAPVRLAEDRTFHIRSRVYILRTWDARMFSVATTVAAR